MNNKKIKLNAGKDTDIFFNASHCPDPTAYQAIKKIEAERERDNDHDTWRFYALLDAIFDICELADFHLEERIVVKDKRTGKIWR